MKKDSAFLNRLKTEGVPWRGVVQQIEDALPDEIEGKNRLAYYLVRTVLDNILGEQNKGWRSERRPSRDGTKNVTWVIAIVN